METVPTGLFPTVQISTLFHNTGRLAFLHVARALINAFSILAKD